MPCPRVVQLWFPKRACCSHLTCWVGVQSPVDMAFDAVVDLAAFAPGNRPKTRSPEEVADDVPDKELAEGPMGGFYKFAEVLTSARASSTVWTALSTYAPEHSLASEARHACCASTLGILRLPASSWEFRAPGELWLWQIQMWLRSGRLRIQGLERGVQGLRCEYKAVSPQDCQARSAPRSAPFDMRCWIRVAWAMAASCQGPCQTSTWQSKVPHMQKHSACRILVMHGTTCDPGMDAGTLALDQGLMAMLQISCCLLLDLGCPHKLKRLMCSC